MTPVKHIYIVGLILAAAIVGGMFLHAWMGAHDSKLIAEQFHKDMQQQLDAISRDLRPEDVGHREGSQGSEDLGAGGAGHSEVSGRRTPNFGNHPGRANRISRSPRAHSNRRPARRTQPREGREA
jgi:hypothetical protein